MGKARIGFEVDEEELASARAFVAKHGGSLNKLDSELFASLGREPGQGVPVADPSLNVLMAASTEKISVLEATHQLELPDAGYVFQRLAKLGLPQPRLPKDFVALQLTQARDALDTCLVNPADAGKKRRLSRRSVSAWASC